MRRIWKFAAQAIGWPLLAAGLLRALDALTGGAQAALPFAGLLVVGVGLILWGRGKPLRSIWWRS